MLKESIRYQLHNAGADLVGFADISGLSNSQNKGYNTAISIGVKLFDGIIDTIIDAPTYVYFHHYNVTNTNIDQIAHQGGVYLENLGYNVLPVAASQMDPHNKNELTSFFSHKTAARLSGLGHIGKSALMITKEYGPRVRFGTLLTNLPIEADTPMTENLCGSCQICVKTCPAQAIQGINFSIGNARDTIYDAHKCHDYIKEHFQISGGGTVCGICINRCPLGQPKHRGWKPDESSYEDETYSY